MKKFEHGGNIYQENSEKEWLDFSANINPLGLADNVQQKLQAQNRFLQIMTTDYTCHMIGMRQVTHIEAARECLLIHCEDGTVYRVHAGIRGFVGENCPDFVFVHRSFAVNADHIRAVTPEEVFLTNGVRLPASRQRYKAICEKLREKFK